MIKLKLLALMSVHFFNIKKIIILTLFSSFLINTIFADEKSKEPLVAADLKASFPAAVIDMQKVLSKSTAMKTLQQIIQSEAVKHLKQISAKEGYLVVFDASTTVITADVINISDVITEKVNKSLPKINLERKKEKKGDN